MEPMMGIAIGFSALNSVLLVALLYFFAKIAISSRASHSIGLFFFALLLLSNSLVTVYAYTTQTSFFGAEALPYLMTVSVLEAIGLSVLLKITL